MELPEDLKGLPDDELETMWEDLAAKREQDRLDSKRLNEERNSRLELAAARERLARLNDAERQALTQVLSVEGIESQEQMGSVGQPETQFVGVEGVAGEGDQ